MFANHGDNEFSIGKYGTIIIGLIIFGAGFVLALSNLDTYLFDQINLVDASIPVALSIPLGWFLIIYGVSNLIDWKKNSSLNKVLDSIPIIHFLKRKIRFLFIALFVPLIFFAIIIISNVPTNLQLITGKKWAVNYLYYKNNYVKVGNSLQGGFGFRLIESINFKEDGRVSLPSINSVKIEGKWELLKDSVRVFNLNDLDSIYSGTYRIEVSKNEIKLTSKNVRLHGVSSFLLN